ncbi:hypothetical protein [Sorangium sp. So ce406]|uniref:hypothetical protein n=1 Tax=Sorangium sp. So ce406 TaxID=3133311 RepID=UPI003F5C0715
MIERKKRSTTVLFPAPEGPWTTHADGRPASCQDRSASNALDWPSPKNGPSIELSSITLGSPGKGGMSWDQEGKTVAGEDGVAVEVRRFPG